VSFPKPTLRFDRAVRRRRIVGFGREGKYLLVILEPPMTLVMHMGMSGHLEVVPHGSPVRHDRLRLGLSGGQDLVMSDPRKFGRVAAVREVDGRGTPKGLKQMHRRKAKEPGEAGFTSEYLRERLQGRTRVIKSVLLLQDVCAGVGNIYSDEALFRAGVKPRRRAGTLTHQEVKRLAEALCEVIADGIRYHGTSLVDGVYVQPDGKSGRYQSKLAVYGIRGDQCGKCRSAIRRVKIGGRSSYFCPKCQK
jgi:formamidopyrimidine-DNA glycosylase